MVVINSKLEGSVNSVPVATRGLAQSDAIRSLSNPWLASMITALTYREIRVFPALGFMQY
jgi:hypothetical protein